MPLAYVRMSLSALKLCEVKELKNDGYTFFALQLNNGSPNGITFLLDVEDAIELVNKLFDALACMGIAQDSYLHPPDDQTESDLGLKENSVEREVEESSSIEGVWVIPISVKSCQVRTPEGVLADAFAFAFKVTDEPEKEIMLFPLMNLICVMSLARGLSETLEQLGCALSDADPDESFEDDDG